MLRRRRLTSLRGYLRFCRVAWAASRPYSALVAATTLLMIALPLLVIAVVGQLVSRLPAAVRLGVDSPDGRTVLTLAVLAGLLLGVQWLATAVREAACEALGSGSKVTPTLKTGAWGGQLPPELEAPLPPPLVELCSVTSATPSIRRSR